MKRLLGLRGLCSSLLLLVLTSAAPSNASQIPVLEGLRPQIDFWKAVFATYTSNQVVFHDPENLSRVYSALDFTDLESSGLSDVDVESRRRQAVRDEIDRLRSLFIELHARGGNADGLGKEDRRIARLFDADSDPNRFLAASAEGRIRAQTGLRDRFKHGLEIARNYLPWMERVFRQEGVPVELTRLPFVESSFNIGAYSRVGAAGLWQFMPATARLYMTVDNYIDERRDPMTSTIAAAKHLKRDYDALGSWPLAVTAYNHGRGGVARAAATTGSNDLVRIVRDYQGPAFGFASRNFYAEFLAALEVEQAADSHFGTIEADQKLHFETAVVPVNAAFSSLARAANVDCNALARLNPALSSVVVNDRVAVPQGYNLRLPSGCKQTFEQRADQVVAVRTRAQTKKSVVTARANNKKIEPRFVRHRVRSGQTLTTIARQYQTSVALIRRHNRLRDSDRVPVGQTLVIPKI